MLIFAISQQRFYMLQLTMLMLHVAKYSVNKSEPSRFAVIFRIQTSNLPKTERNFVKTLFLITKRIIDNLK